MRKLAQSPALRDLLYCRFRSLGQWMCDLGLKSEAAACRRSATKDGWMDV